MANRMIHTPSYLATADIAKKWTSASNTFVTSGWYAPGSSAGNSSFIQTFDAQSGWTVGFLFRHENAGDSGFRQVIIFQSGSTNHVDFRHQGTTGLFEATRNGTVLAVGTTPLTESAEYYIEVQVTIADSGGTAILKVNGVTDINYSGDTKNGTSTTADNIEFSCYRTGSGSKYLKDIYVNDNSGGVDDTFWGPIVVPTLTVSSDGATTAWTPLSSTNASNVDDATPDDDTSYNSTTSSGDTDTFVMTNTGYSAGTVKGVEWASDLELTTVSGTATVAPVYRISSTDYVRTDISPTTSYLIETQRERLSPATASAWTLSELDGMEAGYKRTTA